MVSPTYAEIYKIADDPKSSKNPLEVLSGRLKINWFSPESNLENKFEYSKPGSLDYSL